MIFSHQRYSPFSTLKRQPGRVWSAATLIVVEIERSAARSGLCWRYAGFFDVLRGAMVSFAGRNAARKDRMIDAFDWWYLAVEK